MASTYHGLSRGLQNTRDDARMSFGETGGSDAVQHPKRPVPVHAHHTSTAFPSSSLLDRIIPGGPAGWLTFFDPLVQPHGSPKVVMA